MNREEHLQKTFPLKDGTTYIQSLDKHNEPKEGAGVGGESLKENFIDSTKGIKNWHLVGIYVLIFAALVLVVIYK